MLRIGFVGAALLVAACYSDGGNGDGPAKPQAAVGAQAALRVGFGETDITPDIAKKPVWIAGFGKGRKATGVHDPLMARAIVLDDGKAKIALVSVDLVGVFHPLIESARKKLPGFAYVLVSSTHNHEGPDTIGMWGPNSITTGVDPEYMKQVEDGIVAAVKSADQAPRTVTARIGSALAPDLVHDSRLPVVKHDELVALQFLDGDKTAGIVVQWNCHPETLSSKNTQISADFVYGTVAHLKEKYRCPVVYLTGTVGGLLSSLSVEVKDEQGKPLANGTFEKTERYGRLIGQVAEKALTPGQEVRLTPFEIRTKTLYLPIDNPLYQLGWRLGILQRQAYSWSGDPYKADPVKDKSDKGRMGIKTELGYLKLGDLDVAVIPGEIYPELVLGKVQDPADPAADFPDAPIEPSIYGQLKGKHKMLIGLANDEIGYIIPKRQWDEKPPFAYGLKKTQYGEVNSLGPETAPLLCAAFRELVGKK